MSSVCFFFSIHEPFMLRRYNVFDLGQNCLYEDDERNFARIRQLTSQCYLPALQLLLREIKKTDGAFRFAVHASIPSLELFEQYTPEVLRLLEELAATGAVEFVAGAAHSLAFLYSRKEFGRQLSAYTEMIQNRFGQTPRSFCSTELIYNNDFASFLSEHDYRVMLAEGTDHVLGWRSPNFVYQPVNAPGLRLLLRNRRMTRDLSFRFRDPSWDKWPLTADKYADWCMENSGADVINIFLNMNIFGIVNPPESGIFSFMENLPGAMLNRGLTFAKPLEVIEKYEPRDTIDVEHFISWDDAGGDMNSWLGNDMQKDAIHFLYSMTDRVHALNNSALTHDFTRLQASDYLRWMSTKWFSNYLQNNSPFANPQDAYITFMNILADFEMRLESAIEEKKHALATQQLKEEESQDEDDEKAAEKAAKNVKSVIKNDQKKKIHKSKMMVA